MNGEVVSVIWIDQVKFESDGSDNLMSSGTITPRHYVILKSSSGTAEQRRKLSNLLSIGLIKWPHWSVAEATLADEQVMIEIPGKRIPGLVKGAQMAIKNYRVTGDEWLTGAEFDELEVAGQQIVIKGEEAGTEKTATNSESKTEDSEKPQAELEGRSR